MGPFVYAKTLTLMTNHKVWLPANTVLQQHFVLKRCKMHSRAGSRKILATHRSLLISTTTYAFSNSNILLLVQVSKPLFSYEDRAISKIILTTYVKNQGREHPKQTAAMNKLNVNPEIRNTKNKVLTFTQIVSAWHARVKHAETPKEIGHELHLLLRWLFRVVGSHCVQKRPSCSAQFWFIWRTTYNQMTGNMKEEHLLIVFYASRDTAKVKHCQSHSLH